MPTSQVKENLHTRHRLPRKCPKLIKLTQFDKNHTGTTHKCINLPKSVQITSEILNIICLINCAKCGKQYNGETERSFRNRICEDIASVKKS